MKTTPKSIAPSAALICRLQDATAEHDKNTYEFDLREKTMSKKCFSVVKGYLLKSGLVDHVLNGNANDHCIDVDGLRLAVCDRESEVDPTGIKKFRWSVDILFNRDGFKLQVAPIGPYKKIHAYLNRNKKKILDDIGTADIIKALDLRSKWNQSHTKLGRLLKTYEDSLVKNLKKAGRKTR